MKRGLLVSIIVMSSMTFLVLDTKNVSALAAQNSTSEVTGKVQATVDDGTGYQNYVARPKQAIDDAVMQADKIERSLLAQYKNDSDLIVGVYSYGSLKDLRLTKQQAEIIKNGYIPFLGNPGDPATVNINPKTNVQYAEINGGGSGGRSITACYNPNVPRKAGENNVLVKGSMYGSSNGGYVCADPENIKMNCSIVSEANPCINGMFQLDNSWLLSLGVNIAEIRRQIEANQNPAPTPTPQPTPELNPVSEPTGPFQ